MSGAKRSATSDLNHDNWDQEEAKEEAGNFKLAPPEEIKRRVIKQAVRRKPAIADSINTEEKIHKNVFGCLDLKSNVIPETKLALVPEETPIADKKDDIAETISRNPFANLPRTHGTPGTWTVPSFDFLSGDTDRDTSNTTDQCNTIKSPKTTVCGDISGEYKTQSISLLQKAPGNDEEKVPKRAHIINKENELCGNINPLANIRIITTPKNWTLQSIDVLYDDTDRVLKDTPIVNKSSEVEKVGKKLMILPPMLVISGTGTDPSFDFLCGDKAGVTLAVNQKNEIVWKSLGNPITTLPDKTALFCQESKLKSISQLQEASGIDQDIVEKEALNVIPPDEAVEHLLKNPDGQSTHTSINIMSCHEKETKSKSVDCKAAGSNQNAVPKETGTEHQKSEEGISRRPFANQPPLSMVFDSEIVPAFDFLRRFNLKATKEVLTMNPPNETVENILKDTKGYTTPTSRNIAICTEFLTKPVSMDSKAAGRDQIEVPKETGIANQKSDEGISRRPFANQPPLSMVFDAGIVPAFDFLRRFNEKVTNPPDKAVENLSKYPVGQTATSSMTIKPSREFHTKPLSVNCKATTSCQNEELKKESIDEVAKLAKDQISDDNQITLTLGSPNIPGDFAEPSFQTESHLLSKPTIASEETPKVNETGRSEEFLQNMKEVNATFASWINKNLEQDPTSILTRCFKDYIRHVQGLFDEEKKGDLDKFQQEILRRQEKVLNEVVLLEDSKFVLSDDSEDEL